MLSNTELSGVAHLAACKRECRPDLLIAFHQQNRIAVGASSHIDHKARVLPYTLCKAKIDWVRAPAIHRESCGRAISSCYHHLSKRRRSARQKYSVAAIGSGYAVCSYRQ